MEKKLEICRLPEVGLWYFRLGKVNFLFDDFYKERVLPNMKTLYDSDAEGFLFRRTVVKELNRYTYYLDLDFFFDTVIIKRKETDLEKIDCWFSVVSGRHASPVVMYAERFCVCEEGLYIWTFDRSDEEIFLEKVRLKGVRSFLKFS